LACCSSRVFEEIDNGGDSAISTAHNKDAVWVGESEIAKGICHAWEFHSDGNKLI
jgi:hypothetical protein